MPLEVGIIGAGIAGYAAAIAMRRAGHHVELFERSKLSNEVGAGIHISPNGIRILDHWNFDHDGAGAVEAQQMRVVNPATLEVNAQWPIKNVRERFGHPAYQYHRVDLHSGLRSLAEDKSAQPGPPAFTRVDTQVVDVDVEKGIITLSSGEAIKKDLCIIADGAKTKHASKITEKAEPIWKNGRSVYRALIPFDKITERPELYEYFKDQEPGYWVPTLLPPNPKPIFLITFPCKSGQILNVALLHQTREDQVDSEDWQSPATVDDLLSATEGFHPHVHEILKFAPEVKVFTLFGKALLHRLTKGKAVIIGDAAHLMQPTFAQGAVLALEEAATLEVLFSGVERSDISGRLKLYNDIVLPHAHLVQVLSDVAPFTNPPEREQAAKLSKKPLFPHTAGPLSDPVQDFFWDYDAFEVARKAL
ncbi:hypothetical protein BX600DRAFT_515839 [Xylariales sp. PMI_506]|nr:hypothetical protein BX600DRAFT_515839 [Xylariales sp. PMI_506]